MMIEARRCHIGCVSSNIATEGPAPHEPSMAITLWPRLPSSTGAGVPTAAAPHASRIPPLVILELRRLRRSAAEREAQQKLHRHTVALALASTLAGWRGLGWPGVVVVGRGRSIMDS